MKKRSIALTLCVALIVTLFNFTPSFADDTNYKDKLVAMDILIDTNLEETDFVTRGDLAKFVCFLMNDPRGKISVDLDFYDVRDEYSSYISTAVALGLVSPETEDYFGADSYITLSEAVETMLRCLGYTDEIQKILSPIELTGVTGKIKSGVNGNLGESVRVSELSRIMWNTIQIDILQIKTIGKRVERKTVAGETLLTKYHKIRKGNGIITATDKTYIDKTDKVQKGKILIGGVLYNNGVENLSEYIGRYVEFYYRENDDDLTVVWADEKFDNTVTVMAEDSKISNHKAIYYTGDKRNENKVSAVVNVIYNGKYKPYYTMEDINPKVGNITFIDADDDGLVETIVVKDYIPYVVSSIDYDNSIIFTRGNKTPLYLDKKQDKMVIKQDGKKIDISQLDAGDVLLVAADKYTDVNGVKCSDIRSSECIEIIVSKNSVSGKITMVYNNGEKIEIDGNEYDVSPEYSGENLVLGLDSTFYMDYYGKIVMAYNGDGFTPSTRYGFMTKVGGGGGLGQHMEMRLFDNVLNGWRTVSIADKVKIDGLVLRNEDQIFAKFCCDDNGINTGALIPQLILYSENEDGQINFIDTRLRDKESISLEKSFQGSLAYVNRVFGNKVMISKDAKVLLVPKDEQGNVDVESENKYRWTGYSYFQGDATYEIEIYNMNDESVSNMYVCYYKPGAAVSSGNDSYMVSECIKCLLDDGTVGYKVSLVGSAGSTSVIIDDTTNIRDNDNTALIANKLKKGDVIQFTEISGIASCIRRRFTLRDEDGNIEPFSQSYIDTNLHAYLNMGWGIAYSKGQDSLKLTYSSAAPDDIDKLFLYNTSGVKVIKYDEVTDEVTITSADSICDYLSTKNLDEATKVLVHQRYRYVRAVYIYELK